MRPISSLNPNPFTAISLFKLNFYSWVSLTVAKNSKFSYNTSISSETSEERYGQLLEVCVLDKNLILGKLIHSKIVINGLEKDSFLATKLIGLYSLCGNISLAQSIVNRVSNYNVFIVNSMIRGFSINGLYQQALDFFYRIMKDGFEPDSYTFSCLLKACASLSDIRQGKNIHNLVEEIGLDSDIFVSNALIAMYAKCGSLWDGIHVFERMPHRDIVSWNSIISAYIQNGFDCEAMIKVQELVKSGLRPDHVTITSALSIRSLNVREIHGYVIRNGYESASTIRNSLISVYGKCRKLRESQWLFYNSVQSTDKVAWNAMISCHAQNGCFDESINLLRNMKLSGLDLDVITYSGIISSFSQNGQSDGAMRIFDELLSSGLKPDIITIASILPAISDLQYLDYCKEIHGYSFRNRLESDRRVRNALVSVYSKLGSVQSAVNVFAQITDRDVISWSSMVVGYAQNGCFNEALITFGQMIRVETEPNPITITSILSACTGTSSLRQGRELHLWALKNGFEGQTFVGSALIDMYAKCGRIKDSRRVFDLMTEKNLVTWNSMIGGYAIHGLGQNALEIFRRVIEPDHISFIAALSACNHGGLVDEGIEIFNGMKIFGISPSEGHYACMVDILGRSGRLSEALDLIKKMPMEVNVDIWGALLGACKIHSNLEIGIYAGARIFESDCENPGYYVLLSNILADFGRWEDVEVMRKVMKEKGVKKGVGCSWIEVHNGMHSFVARERAQHPEWEDLFKILKSLNEQMKGNC
ncbi:pentatricopeptide repeat-containing protein At5g16860-like [Tasmannia lanceolata]|uniref:pentatricopeptide repeat-containing protein At5g16860-like n=1 Tax=Tasmannia lanceolata TaxID=3420 RepID=UPI004062D547